MNNFKQLPKGCYRNPCYSKPLYLKYFVNIENLNVSTHPYLLLFVLYLILFFKKEYASVCLSVLSLNFVLCKDINQNHEHYQLQTFSWIM